MKLKLLLLLFLAVEITFSQNAIIVVIDGARYTETFGAVDPSSNIPHLWNELKPLGTLYSDFRNTGVTFTNSGHSTLLTGTWQSLLNDGSEKPTKPTIFEYFRKDKSALISENYVITGKEKLKILNYSIDEQYGSNYMASVLAENLTDNVVYANLVSVMDTYHPKLIIVNFPGVDLAGHSGDWTAYINAIFNADSLVNELWNKIQSDPYYQNTTTLFITNDHGRHTDDFRSHGDNCEGCEHIMLLALGRNIPKNNIITSTRYQRDIAPSIGQLLSFSTDQATGSSIFTDSNLQPIDLNIKLYLEGPYNNGSMTSALNIQPHKKVNFPIASKRYYGNDTLPPIPENNIIDIVRVELRTDKDVPSDIQKNALLLGAGSIVDFDEVSPLSFNIIPGNYFIVIKHRNHLSVMSSEAVPFP